MQIPLEEGKYHVEHKKAVSEGEAIMLKVILHNLYRMSF